MLIWMDIETTGLDPLTGSILEVAAIAVNDRLDEVARFHVVLHSLMMPEEPVRTMHTDSGLLLACQYSAVQETDADYQFCGWLDGLKQESLVMAGSGVSHFDRPWLKDHAWLSADKFEYWMVDVGVMRRGLKILGVGVPDPPKKRHRAMDDAEQHLSEFRLLGEVLTQETEEVL